VKFSLNKPIETAEPTVVVDRGLPAGLHRFQLVVVNRAGQSSAAVTVDVVLEPQRTATPGGIPTPGPIVVGPLRPPFPP
jgi:hypothetical protein